MARMSEQFRERSNHELFPPKQSVRRFAPKNAHIQIQAVLDKYHARVICMTTAHSNDIIVVFEAVS